MVRKRNHHCHLQVVYNLLLYLMARNFDLKSKPLVGNPIIKLHLDLYASRSCCIFYYYHYSKDDNMSIRSQHQARHNLMVFFLQIISAEPIKLFPSNKRISIFHNGNIKVFKNRIFVRNHSYKIRLYQSYNQ